MPTVTKAIMEQSLALATNEKRCHSFTSKVSQLTCQIILCLVNHMQKYVTFHGPQVCL